MKCDYVEKTTKLQASEHERLPIFQH